MGTIDRHYQYYKLHCHLIKCTYFFHFFGKRIFEFYRILLLIHIVLTLTKTMHTIFHIMTIYLPYLHIFDEVYILKDYFSDRNVLHVNIGLHERKLHEMKFHYQLFLIIILSMCILVFFVRQIMFLRKFSYQTYGLNASKRITTHLGYRCNLLTSTI